MRRGEILNLKWDWIDPKKGYITVTKTKSGKDRNIPISSALMQEFIKLNKEKRSDYVFLNSLTQKPYGKIDKSFKTIIKKAGIENLRFHDLRHTAATRMVALGVEIIIVQDILGHSDIRTTMRYAHPMPERKVKAIQALSDYGRKEKIIAFKTKVK
jgi:integrase